MLPLKSLRNIYFAFYQSILQYGLLVWVGVKDNNRKNVQLNQNCIVRIILNKKTLEGSTNQNYKLLGVLPISLLYKKIALMFVIKKLIISSLCNQKNYIKIREHRAYDPPVKYAKKSFDQSIVDYLCPNFFN